MRTISTTWLITVALFFSAHCNLEVGNPDADGPAGLAPFNSLAFTASGGQCTAQQQDCVAVPVIFSAGKDSGITFEIQELQMQLSRVELKPFQFETPLMQLNLLLADRVALGRTYESSAITDLGVDFSASRTGETSSLQISGRVIFDDGAQRSVIPLSIAHADIIRAEATVFSSGNVIDSVVFDATRWFDFSDLSHGAHQQILHALTSGPCRDVTSRACENYRDVLSQSLAKNISRSMSVKSVKKGDSKKKK